MRTVVFAPGATTAGDSISLPTNAPPISHIIGAVLYVGHSVDEGGTATYDIGATSVTATKADESTITLDSNTAALDILVLQYNTVGELAMP